MYGYGVSPQEALDILAEAAALGFASGELTSMEFLEVLTHFADLQDELDADLEAVS